MSSRLPHEVLIEQGIAGPYLSPETKYFAPAFKDKNGLWTTLCYNPMTFIYNTRLIPPGEHPKDGFDLLNPKLKGKLAIEHEQVTWYAGMIDFMLSDQAAEVLAKENRIPGRSDVRGLTRSLKRSMWKRFCRCRWKSCRVTTKIFG